MTLKEKYLDIVKIPFKDEGYMYDIDKANQCIEIADEFAIDFLNWCMSEEAKDLMEDLALIGEINKYVTTEQVLEIFKKEKGS